METDKAAMLTCVLTDTITCQELTQSLTIPAGRPTIFHMQALTYGRR